jgi:maleylacetoacetate isomerase
MYELTLYHYWRSSCSWRVRWALQHKNISYRSVSINLLQNEQQSPEYLKLNPQGFLPLLEIKDSKGNVFRLAESMAIIDWIDRSYPENPLFPPEPTDRARALQMSLMIASGIQPIQNLSVLRKLSSEAHTQQTWARHWIESGFEKLESLVASGSSFMISEQITIADLTLAPQMYNARRFNCAMTQFPKLSHIDECLSKLPGYKASCPEAFAPPT